jgi:hypothetical protein
MYYIDAVGHIKDAAYAFLIARALSGWKELWWFDGHSLGKHYFLAKLKGN